MAAAGGFDTTGFDTTGFDTTGLDGTSPPPPPVPSGSGGLDTYGFDTGGMDGAPAPRSVAPGRFPAGAWLLWFGGRPPAKPLLMLPDWRQTATLDMAAPAGHAAPDWTKTATTN